MTGGQGPDGAGSAPLTDPIGLVFTAMGAGATGGAFVITIGVGLIRLLQRNAVEAQQDQTSFLVLTISVMLGPVICATIVMVNTRPVNDLWRRSVAAAISIFVAFLLSGLSAPIDMLTGPWGLALFAVGLITASVLLTRRTHVILQT